jgi:hypothetical protein
MESTPAARVATLGLALLASGCCCGGDCTDDKGKPEGVTPPPTSVAAPKVPCDGGVPPPSHKLDISVIGQQSSLLCWAAVTEMVASHFNKAPKGGQCKQLNRRNASCGDPNQNVPTTQQCVGCMESKNTPFGPCNSGGFPDFAGIDLQANRTHDA